MENIPNSPLPKHFFITRQAPIILFLKIVILSIFFDILILIISFLSDFFPSFRSNFVGDFFSYCTLAYLLLVFLQFIIFLAFLVHWFREFYMVENDAIIYKRGIFFPKEKIHLIDKMAAISFSQNMWGKAFHYGDIYINFSGEREPVIISKIANPREFIHIIEHNRIGNGQHVSHPQE